MILEAKVRLREQETGRTSVCVIRDVEGIEVGDIHLLDLPGSPTRHWEVEQIFEVVAVTEAHLRT